MLLTDAAVDYGIVFDFISRELASWLGYAAIGWLLTDAAVDHRFGFISRAGLVMPCCMAAYRCSCRLPFSFYLQGASWLAGLCRDWMAPSWGTGRPGSYGKQFRCRWRDFPCHARPHRALVCSSNTRLCSSRFGQLVEEVIGGVKPEVVMVELDAERICLLPPGEAMEVCMCVCAWQFCRVLCPSFLVPFATPPKSYC